MNAPIKTFEELLERALDPQTRTLLAVAMSTFCAGQERDALAAVTRLRDLAEGIPADYRGRILEGEEYFRGMAAFHSEAAKHFADDAAKHAEPFKSAIVQDVEAQAVNATKH